MDIVLLQFPGRMHTYLYTYNINSDMGEVYFAFNFSIDHHVSILISLLRCEVIDSNHTKLHRKLNIHIEYKVLNITRHFLFRLVTRGTVNSGISKIGVSL